MFLAKHEVCYANEVAAQILAPQVRRIIVPAELILTLFGCIHADELSFCEATPFSTLSDNLSVGVADSSFYTKEVF